MSPFDGLLSFSEATEMWGLSSSALRKAVTYGKLIPEVDCKKYGSVWIVTEEAMFRKYGEPKTNKIYSL